MNYFKSSTMKNAKKANLSSLKKIKYFIGICKGLQELHNSGYVHRDIKPENIFWDKDNSRLVIGDLGIAKKMNENFTKNIKKLANFDFHAPEQGKISKNNISYSTDVFALGQLLYWFITGSVLKGQYEKIIDHEDGKFINLYKLDELIKNMTKLNPLNRIELNDVINKLEDFIKYKDINDQKINYFINKNNLSLYKDSIEKIYYLIEIDKNKIDRNCVDSNFISKLSFNLNDCQITKLWNIMVKNVLIKKYEYEGNQSIYEFSNNKIHKKTNKKQKNKFLELIKKINLGNKNLSKKMILSSKYSESIEQTRMFKIFSDLKHYHAEEIFVTIFKDIELKIQYNCKDRPPLWIYKFTREKGMNIDVSDLVFKRIKNQNIEQKFYNKTIDECLINKFKNLFPLISVEKLSNEYHFFPIKYCKKLLQKLTSEMNKSSNKSHKYDIENIIYSIKANKSIDIYDFELMNRLIK